MTNALREKAYETVIWDWNGTMLNDVWLCVEIVNSKILPRHNELRLDETAYRDVFGFPITAYYDRIGVDLERESMDMLTEIFISTYDQSVLKCNLHTAVVNALNTFKNNSLTQYVLTAAHKESVIPLLNHFDIHHYFEAIEGLDNHRAESKVNRGIALLQNNNISQKQTVLIGDTNHDFEVAEALGIDCILVAAGHQSKERLLDESKGKAWVIDDLKELL